MLMQQCACNIHPKTHPFAPGNTWIGMECSTHAIRRATALLQDSLGVRTFLIGGAPYAALILGKALFVE